MSKMAKMIVRLKSSDRTGSDIDKEIALLIGWAPPAKDGVCGPGYQHREEYEWHDHLGNPMGFTPPKWTSSIDAAVKVGGYDYEPVQLLIGAMQDLARDDKNIEALPRYIVAEYFYAQESKVRPIHA